MAERRDEGRPVAREAVGYGPAPHVPPEPAGTRPADVRPGEPLGAPHSAHGAIVAEPAHTGTTYTGAAPTGSAHADGSKSPAEIERDIRRTRAEMSETVDAIERKLSPEHLKHELQESMHEGIDYIRERFDPRRIAKNTGRSMLDTIKENPLPSLIAGLSIGWLLVKGNEHDHHERRDDTYRRTGYYGRGYYGPADYRQRSGWPSYGAYPETYYPGAAAPYGRTGAYGTETYGSEDAYRTRQPQDHDGDGGRSMKDRIGEKAGDVRHRASEMAENVQTRFEDVSHDVQHRMHDFGHEVRHQSRRTVSELERFVHQNPLAAGAIAAGLGALLGTLLPSTHVEDEWMGGTRDRVMHQARDVAEGTLERSRPVAQRVVGEVKDAVREVKETARHEARHVMSAAKEGAHDVKEEARQEVRDKT